MDADSHASADESSRTRHARPPRAGATPVEADGAARDAGPGAEPAPGTCIGGRYRVQGRLGEGATSAVYGVIDEATGATRALKLLRVHEVPIAAEFRAMARLEHPGCVRVHGIGEDPRHGSYLVMDRLEGQPPTRILPAGDTPGLVGFARRVVEVLGYLHSNDVAHGDLKPENICCLGGDPRRPVLLDFGLAAVCKIGDLGGGTPRYMAPELLRGELPDARSDLYALGVVLYELVAGRPPFPRSTAHEVMRAHLHDRPRPLAHCAPDARPELCSLVDGLLAKDPGARPASAYEVLARLAELDGEGLDAGPLAVEARLAVGTPAVVGRDDVLATFDRLLDGAAAGRAGGLLVLHGPPGSGRTRALAEVAVRARLAGVEVRSCPPLVDGSGAAPSRVLRALGDTAEPAAEPPGSWARGADAMGPLDRSAHRAADLLEAACASRPLLLTCDDLGPESSDARLLRRVAPVLSGLRCLIVIAADDDMARQLAPVADALVPLAPLCADDLTRLLRGALGEVDAPEQVTGWLAAQCGGAPADALDGIRWLVESGALRRRGGRWISTRELSVVNDEPWRARSASARRRVLALSPEDRRVLQVAALLGDPFDAALLERVAGVHDAGMGLARLVSARLLTPGAGDRSRLGFARRSVRAALLEDLCPEARRALHGRLAEELRHAAEPGIPAGVSIGNLARHLIFAGEVDEGVPLLQLAVDDLRGRSAHDAARSLLETILGELRLVPEAEGHLPELMAQLGDLWMDVDEPERALAAFEGGAARAPHPERSRLVARAGAALTRLGRYPKAVEALEEALLGSCLDGPDALRAAHDLAWCHMMRGAFGEALTAAERATGLAAASGSRASLARSLRLRGTILWRTGDTEAALAASLEALECFAALGDRVEAAFTWLEIGNAHRSRAQLAEARSAYREALERFEQAGHRRGVGKARNNLGVVAYHLGDWDEATACFEAFLAVVDRTGEQIERVVLLNNLGTLYKDRGELTRAIEVLERGRALAERLGASRLLAMILGNLGEAVTRTGRRAQAYPLLREARALSVSLEAADELLETDRRLLACTQGAGASAGDLRRAQELLERAAREGNALEEGNLAGVVADLLRRSGRPAEACGAAERGLRALGPTGTMLEAARVRVRWAEALADLGERERAEAEARAAEGVFARLGAAADRVMAARLVRGLSAATPPATPAADPRTAGPLRLLKRPAPPEAEAAGADQPVPSDARTVPAGALMGRSPECPPAPGRERRAAGKAAIR